MSSYIPSVPERPFITIPEPPPIPVPTPRAAGTLVRKPRHLIYANGQRLRMPLEITTTRGLDQDVATCDITYRYPLPPGIPYWSRIAVLLGTNPLVPGEPYSSLRPRFSGYFIEEQDGLWPGTVTLHCESSLALAKWTYTPEEMDLGGDTDQQAIVRILNPPEGSNQGGVGLGANLTDIQGWGTALSEVDEANLFWEVGQTAMEKIQDIDAISAGYRTYDTVSGRVLRRLINTSPSAETVVHWFNEGVDILEGSMTTETLSPKNEITVAGFTIDPTTVSDDEDPFAWRTNTYWIRFLMLRARLFGTGPSPTVLAEYILSQLNRKVLKVTFTTFEDVYFQGQEVIGITSPRLRVNQKFWVQSVQTTLDSKGQFAQTITAISELGPYQRRTISPPVQTPDGVPPGAVAPIGEQFADGLTPSSADILADFTIDGLDHEKAAGAEAPTSTGAAHYGVTCSDTSSSRQGRIVAWSWVASGTGVRVETGSEQTFTTAFTDPADATIELTVTDENGQTATVTQGAFERGLTPLLSRKLYACTETTMEAYDGNVWRSLAPVGSLSVQVVGGGPYWGCGQYVAYSADDLQTPPTETLVVLGENVSSIWIHEEDAAFVGIGTFGGSVAFSEDHAATWTLRTGPSPGMPINFIIVSIFDKNEVHVVTEEGWFKSQDRGVSWELVRAGDFIYLELSHSRNIVVTAAGVLEKAEDGTPFTGNTEPIVAATAHIREDRFYALGESGTTWYVAESGGYALTQGVSIPDGTPYPAGTYRDGLMVDLVYFAAQDGGLWKTLDGFKTADGYLRLRRVGLLTP